MSRTDFHQNILQKNKHKRRISHGEIQDERYIRAIKSISSGEPKKIFRLPEKTLKTLDDNRIFFHID
ncbi:MAG: hypothetical protein IJV56_07230 [Neisseriaceae bacterium]|nr:hypothetical protein [Neisseriaceae bacterium]